ncbi:MAG: DNA-directed RNA polymerase subunit alpha [Patescibacteria group bacterium]
MDYNIVLPSKPKVVKENDFSGSYEIEGLYPGYGHTLGNSLRRIILASLTGSSITNVKIDGVSHEFSTINGIKEDVISILLNLKKIKIKMTGTTSSSMKLKAKGPKEITAKDIEAPGQIEILNKDQHIASLVDKNSELDMEIMVESGIGYVPKEMLQKDRVEVGVITMDASFSPIRRATYDVELMRVGDRTDFNKLIIFIETDGTITPKEVLEKSISIMINQLKAIVGFKEEEVLPEATSKTDSRTDEDRNEFLKTRIESLNISARTLNALTNANIRTVGGLVRKKESDILEVEGLGAKGLDEIKALLSDNGFELKP